MTSKIVCIRKHLHKMSEPNIQISDELLLEKKKLFLILNFFFMKQKETAKHEDLKKAYELAKTSNSNEQYIDLVKTLRSNPNSVPGVNVGNESSNNDKNLEVHFEDSFEVNTVIVIEQNKEDIDKFSTAIKRYDAELENHRTQYTRLISKVAREETTVTNFIKNNEDTFIFV